MTNSVKMISEDIAEIKKEEERLKQLIDLNNRLVLSQETVIIMDKTVRVLCEKIIDIQVDEMMRSSAELVNALASYRSLICKVV